MDTPTPSSDHDPLAALDEELDDAMATALNDRRNAQRATTPETELRKGEQRLQWAHQEITGWMIELSSTRLLRLEGKFGPDELRLSALSLKRSIDTVLAAVNDASEATKEAIRLLRLERGPAPDDATVEPPEG